ncbi:MAG: nucleotidyltransferase domain-containing protein [Deltaproteobacteria bacterium]|jgi:predicted nucleotidyltransferase|nr:nucleotidyltransferase domain-containing protein [Deltaproteobacteria bacterium]MBT4524927.1 nucleotidyltransferase domain-containing protein [Deltaproteobacteria bacterium]
MSSSQTPRPFGYFVEKRKDNSKKKMEQNRQKTLFKLKKVLLELSKQIEFKEVIFFGSLTQQYRFADNSDIDIAFRGLSNADYFSTIAFISNRLKRDIDVIQLETQCRFKEKIIKTGIKWQKPELL